MDVAAELAHLEVADRDPGEDARLRPVFVASQVGEEIDAVPVEVGGEEDVHEEQLPDDVTQIHELDQQVEHGQVVPVLLTGHEVDAPSHGRPEAG